MQSSANNSHRVGLLQTTEINTSIQNSFVFHHPRSAISYSNVECSLSLSLSKIHAFICFIIFCSCHAIVFNLFNSSKCKTIARCCKLFNLVHSVGGIKMWIDQKYSFGGKQSSRCHGPKCNWMETFVCKTCHGSFFIICFVKCYSIFHTFYFDVCIQFHRYTFILLFGRISVYAIFPDYSIHYVIWVWCFLFFLLRQVLCVTKVSSVFTVCEHLEIGVLELFVFSPFSVFGWFHIVLEISYETATS